VTFSINASGGPVTLGLRYSAGNGVARRKVTLDGVVKVANQAFPATVDWNSWSTVTLNANLTKGLHSLKVWFDQSAGSAQYLNLDNLMVKSTLVIFARSAARNVTTESRYPGSASAPYVCCWGSQGQYVTFSFNALGGATTLGLRYSSGNGVSGRKIELDGAVKVANQRFPATSTWSAWSWVNLNATLTTGRHTLKIWFDRGAGSNNYLNLDVLAVKTG
jgi:hypothetical protein